MTSHVRQRPILAVSLGSGRVEGLYRTASAALPLQSEGAVSLLAGRGVLGDRYFLGTGTWQQRGYGDQLSLIAAESLEALEQETGIRLGPAEARRNVVTRGLHLETLIGARFLLGGVLCQGLRLIPPCAHLEWLTLPGVQEGLRGRGGLYAAILSTGTVAVGDPVALAAVVAPNSGLRSAESC